ncbi:MAG: hypothetical protein QOH74_1463 [Gaiellales bacterium]|jgi:hypothetical protein|nr:hypothetical protein [Gaiellales bacterium]
MSLSRPIDDVMDAISTQQRATVRDQLASPAWWLIVAGAGLVAGFVAWFVGGTVIAGLATAPAGVIAAVVLTWWAAGQSARLAAYGAWADAHGLESTNALRAPLTTPLLQQGEQRDLERAYRGTVAGLEMVVGHFTWISVKRSHRDDETISERRTPHPFTVVQVVTGLSGVLRFALLPRARGASLLAAAETLLGPDRVVELESTELEDSFRVTVADEDSEIAVRRLFTPSLIVDIVDAMPADALVEFGEGALLVALPSHRYEPDLLDALVAVAEAFTKHLVRLGSAELTASGHPAGRGTAVPPSATGPDGDAAGR